MRLPWKRQKPEPPQEEQTQQPTTQPVSQPEQENQESAELMPLEDMTPGMQDLVKFLQKYDAMPTETQVNVEEGWFQRTWYSIFGKRLKDVKIKTDHKFMGWLGSILAPALLVLFSISAILVIEKQEISRIPWIVNNVPIIMIATTVLFVITMDVCMLLAIVWIRDIFSSKRAWTNQRIALVTVLILFVLVIAGIEGLTFFAMLTGAEVSGLLNVCRAVWIPICAVFLMSRPKLILNREGVDQIILVKVVTALLSALERLSISAQAKFGDLLEIFLHLTLPDNPTEEALQKGRDTALIGILNKMRPQAWVEEAKLYFLEQRSSLQKEIEQKRQEIEDQRIAIQRQNEDIQRNIIELESQLTRANENLTQEIMRVENEAKEALFLALLHISQHGELPQHIIDGNPKLADIRFTSTGKPRRNIGGNTTSSASIDTTDYRGMYMSQFGKEPPTKYKKSKQSEAEPTRGVMVVASEVIQMVSSLDNKVIGTIIDTTGNGAYVGAAKAARLDAILKNPTIRSHLIPVWKEFIDRANPLDSGEVSEQKRAS